MDNKMKENRQLYYATHPYYQNRSDYTKKRILYEGKRDGQFWNAVKNTFGGDESHQIGVNNTKWIDDMNKSTNDYKSYFSKNDSEFSYPDTHTSPVGAGDPYGVGIDGYKQGGRTQWMILDRVLEINEEPPLSRGDIIEMDNVSGTTKLTTSTSYYVVDVVKIMITKDSTSSSDIIKASRISTKDSNIYRQDLTNNNIEYKLSLIHI